MHPAFYDVSSALQLDRVFERVNRNRPVVLTLHGVTDDAGAGIYNDDTSHMHVDVFRGLMRWIVSRYTVVRFTDIARWLKGDAGLPERALALTFDDGYRNILTTAAPILRHMDIPATIFVATDFVFEERSLWPDRVLCAVGATRQRHLSMAWDDGDISLPLESQADRLAANHRLRVLLKQLPDSEKQARTDRIVDALGVRETRAWESWAGFAPLRPEELPQLVASGIDVGSHTCSHPIVARCAPEQIRDEVRRSRALIESAGVPCQAFAYPNGAPGDFNAESRSEVVAAGYECAATTLKLRVQPGIDPYEIPRMMVTRKGFTMRELGTELSGFPAALRRLIGRAR